MYQSAARSTFVLTSLTNRALEALHPPKISDPKFTQFWLKKFEESQFWPALQSHAPTLLEFPSSVPVVSLKASCHLLDHKVPGNTLVPGVPEGKAP